MRKRYTACTYGTNPEDAGTGTILACLLGVPLGLCSLSVD